ncbi:ABC-type multidrug transport system, ATPase component [Chthonomonas calidirosea]|uniref:ABC-type multidrug transport system, ATPase component n=1 Tax=Chthonomonas calidirosea (strain DSM 23976 / ICMP 18418 / T49) TaxID=1303518 RepID=S0ET40_CHTCT|nr:ATP-binding cassette domain-containing protein [Chthonomonas calidirosea]CCW34591.1 ABC-type multidrug transport system, ATPase component [Chthonomonas calidirosea T49]CEK14346.1 ABC-type multidrug transport system, ATPase component [Chthonomonas calidirosea]
MDEDDVLLQVDDLRKTYDDITAVDGVSFSVKRGEIFGLLGPNGAGKTTTINMLAGILLPTAGQILFEGVPYRAAPEERSRLGVVPQELAIYTKLTGRENLFFFGRLYGLQGSVLARRVAEVLELVGLAEHADRLVEKYSGGMKRRLNLAAGLLHAPQLLLLDEPTVGVDPQSRNHIFEGIRALNRNGLTILYTSHYMEEVQMLCHRVGIIDRGKLIACDTVANLIAREGGSAIELIIEGKEASLDIQKIDDELKAALSLVPFVDVIEVKELSQEGFGQPVIMVYSAKPYQVLPELVRLLNSYQLPIASINIKQPTLEDVFLSLTGKHLRD